MSDTNNNPESRTLWLHDAADILVHQAGDAIQATGELYDWKTGASISRVSGPGGIIFEGAVRSFDEDGFTHRDFLAIGGGILGGAAAGAALGAVLGPAGAILGAIAGGVAASFVIDNLPAPPYRDEPIHVWSHTDDGGAEYRKYELIGQRELDGEYVDVIAVTTVIQNPSGETIRESTQLFHAADGAAELKQVNQYLKNNDNFSNGLGYGDTVFHDVTGGGDSLSLAGYVHPGSPRMPYPSSSGDENHRSDNDRDGGQDEDHVSGAFTGVDWSGWPDRSGGQPHVDNTPPSGGRGTPGPNAGDRDRHDILTGRSPPGYYDRDPFGVDNPDNAPGAPSQTSNAPPYNNYDAVGPRPVILDLDGDGIEVSLNFQASFDYDGDGFREWTSWSGPDDGFLVLDLNADGTRGDGDGVIDQRAELVLSDWGSEGATDLQALAEARDADGNLIFDTNGDGVLDANDSGFGEFRVWQDLDQDGVTDEGELRTLGEAGITGISLRYDSGLGYGDSSDDLSVGRAKLLGTASLVIDGETREGGVGDVELTHAGYGWRLVELDDGYRLEFEAGDVVGLKRLDDGETDFDLGDDTSIWQAAEGNDGNNLLDASAKTEDVMLNGGAGSDTLRGGAGSDLLTGGAGRDAMHGGAGHDVIHVDAEDDFLLDGIARITGGEGYDHLILAADTDFTGVDIDALGFEAVDLSDSANSVTGGRDGVNYHLDGKGGDDSLSGAGGNDVLIGGTGRDTLIGKAGNDRLFGEDGFDRLDGGDGNDVLAGGRGEDEINGGAGDDVYLYRRGDGIDLILDQAFENDDGSNVPIDGGHDTLRFGDGIGVEDLALIRSSNGVLFVLLRDDTNANVFEREDQIRIRNWTDVNSRIEIFEFADGTRLDLREIMSGQAFYHRGHNILYGTADGDSLSGGNGDDVLNGNAGRDLIVGGAGSDTIRGGTEEDLLFGNDGNDRIRGGEGDDFLVGGAGYDWMEGNDGDDILSGDGGDDVLSGGAGSDVLFGGTGYDDMFGGGGDDTYVWLRGDGRAIIYDIVTDEETSQRLDGGDDTLRFGFTVGIEDLFVASSGNYIRIGLRDRDTVVTETIGYWDDPITIGRIQESGFRNVDDVVWIMDWSNSENRIETFEFANGLTLDMSEVTHALSGLAGNDFLHGTGSGDFLSGGRGNDRLYGYSGKDLLVGGAGNDRLYGMDGSDLLIGGEGDDYLSGGSGRDDLSGGNGNDRINGGSGADYLTGGTGNDRLEGQSGNDVISGADGDDRLLGDLGDDVLLGGTGTDTLQGGPGDDVYIFNRGDGHDTIDESSGTTRRTSQAVDDGKDTLRFGSTISVEDLIIYGFGSDLKIRIRDQDDLVTIKDWYNATSRIETFEFADGLTLDVSEATSTSSVHYFATDGRVLQVGSDYGDILSCLIDRLILFGADGDDFLFGNEGSNTLVGGRGRDSLFGGAGDDLLSGNSEADYLIAGGGNDTLYGGNGEDALSGGPGEDLLYGGDGDDVYFFNRGDGHDIIDESEGRSDASPMTEGGRDTLWFGEGIDHSDLIISTVDGELVIELAPGADGTEVEDSVTLRGLATPENRVETLRFANGLTVDISDLTRARTGTAADESISARTVRDISPDENNWSSWIAGGAGNDYLYGSDNYDNDDILIGGAGNDFMAGGMGNDTYIINRGDGWDQIYDIGSSVGGDRLLFGVGINLEDLVLQLENGNLTVYIGDKADMTIPIFQIEDVVMIWSGGRAVNRVDVFEFLDGQEFDFSGLTNTYLGADLTDLGTSIPSHDRLTGSDAMDWMDGFAGDDRLSAGAGDDYLLGRDGNDVLWGEDGNDVISGGEGNDRLYGGKHDDKMVGGAGDDSIYGEAGNDVMVGGSGNDTLWGGFGNDVFVGGAGNDTYRTGYGNNIYRFGFGDGQDVYKNYGGSNSITAYGRPYTRSIDVFVFEDGVTTDHLWFERDGTSLVLRLLGFDDSIQFKNWFSSVSSFAAKVAGFQVGDQYLSQTKVKSLLEVMENLTPNLGDSDYGVTVDEMPETVASAIDAAWVTIA